MAKTLREEKIKEQLKELSDDSEDYFKNLKEKIDLSYDVAGKARAKGLDPDDKVEVPLAMTMAAKVVRLISTKYSQLDREDVIERILELERQYGALDMSVSFKIAEEIAKEKYCKFETQLEAMDAGIRVGFAYATLGVVSSPIEGYTEIKTGKTKTGETYLRAYFSGPIRSAGTTASCVVLMIIDYIRQLFGYARYDPTEEECKRVVTELYDYHERVTNLQYLPTEDEVFFLAQHMPFQVCGDPTEKKEVSNYKDLARVETNFIRGGFCLIMGEGLAQKAPKGLRILKKVQKNGFKVHDWEWLDEYVEMHEKRTVGKSGDDSPTYIKDLVAGRPVLGHPQKGFRFRYGRSRVAGFSAVSISPATMGITSDFIATGTQLKIEKPTKGCITTPCDSIDGPIVKLKNGDVRKIKTYEEAKDIYERVDEIIYLGDMLFPLGDVMNRNSKLVKPGYVEEWWNLELEKGGGKVENFFKVDISEAVKLSQKFGIPLHPSYIYYWTQLSYEEFLGFIDWFSHSRVNEGKLLFPYNSQEKERFKVGKRALEILGVIHTVGVENVILRKQETSGLLLNLGFDLNYEGELNISRKFDSDSGQDVDILKIINEMSEFKIKDKAGEFIGSRMGRPEKAKIRKLIGSPHVLFPVGNEGGRLRSVNETYKVGTVRGDFPFNYCDKCQRESIYRVCEVCGGKNKVKSYCNRCKVEGEECSVHGKTGHYKNTRINMAHYFENAKKKLGMLKHEIPELIKGVRGTSSENHDLENLCKGILRSKYNLNVNKDGSVRYDMTEVPLSHFKPCEIGVGVEKLKELGYLKDWKGKELVDENQILELKPHDVLLPCNDLSGDERADVIFMNVARFVDELLVKFYGLEPFYNIKSREDLIGQLAVNMAPHNCAGVISRIIGFTKIQGLVGSPYLHAAMRRDCLSYDNYVSIEKNGKWIVDKIGNIIEGVKPCANVDCFGTLGSKVRGVNVWSNPGKQQVCEMTKHTPGNLLKIRTEDGRVLEVTENHKLYVKGKIEKRACEIVEGDKLMVSYKRDINEADIDSVFLPEIFQDRDDVMLRGVRDFLSNFESMSKHENYCFRDSFPIKMVKGILEKSGRSLRDLPDSVKIAIKRDRVSLPLRIKFDAGLFSLIGLYIAEGYMREVKSEKGLFQVYFAAQDEEVREYIYKNMFQCFGLKPSEKKPDRVNYSSRLLYELFKNYFGLSVGAKNKRIPSMFLNFSLDKVAVLLRGYFEGDGSVSLSDIRITCDSVSEGLKHDLSFVLSRFGIFTKFYEYEKEPGPRVRDFYIKKGEDIPKFKITKIIVPSDFVSKFSKIGFLSNRKNRILKEICERNPYGMKIDFDEGYVYPRVVSVESGGERESYCFNVLNEHKFFANDFLVHNCDGDEASISLLLDVLINFSKKFLPSHRGGTQDAPLVLNGRILAREVDDQILDFELVDYYPLDLYEKAEKGLHSSEVDIEMVKQRIGRGEDPYVNVGFTHDTSDFNMGAVCSSYKILPTMKEKVEKQMELCEKLRAVDQSDVARLIIDRHFMRDLKGNLRKFSQQTFRCSSCNTIYRRPPLNGRCPCGGNIIFTIAYGSIIKYLEPALDLTRNYNVSAYIKQDLELTKKYIESIFGRDDEKQEALERWF